MAEGGLEGLIGGEGGDGPEGGLGGGADPAAMALALDAAQHDPDLSRKAGAYLDEQRRLVKIQTEHLHEQRAVQLSHLRLRRNNEAIRLAVQALLALIVAGFVAGLGVMIWDATQDHGVVVEPFSVPPALAQRGVTGAVVAQEMLDHLNAMQQDTTSERPSNSYQNDWGGELKVEIPETGVSLDDVQRLLVRWLGHETRITGEVVETPDAVAISARAGDGAAVNATGAQKDFDALVTQTAEAIYRQTQPYRYGIYLFTHGRPTQAQEILQGLTQGADATERAWAYVGLANMATSRGDEREAWRDDQLSIQAKPDFVGARENLSGVLSDLEHEEDASKLMQYTISHKAGLASLIPKSLVENDIVMASAALASITHDAALAHRAEETASRPQSGVKPVTVLVARMIDGTLAHDPAEIRRAANATKGLPGSTSPGDFGLAQAGLEVHDSASVALFEAVMAADRAKPGGIEPSRRDDAYWLAKAKAAFGDLAGARALIFSTPTDCYECVMGRGEILAQAGDRAGAEGWFAQAIRQGPDIPRAFTARGAARLNWGDLAGALSDAQTAARLSPHDPDALKLWGDVLVRQGEIRPALEKYDAALKLAPHWTALKQARAVAARRT